MFEIPIGLQVTIIKATTQLHQVAEHLTWQVQLSTFLFSAVL